MKQVKKPDKAPGFMVTISKHYIVMTSKQSEAIEGALNSKSNTSFEGMTINTKPCVIEVEKFIPIKEPRATSNKSISEQVIKPAINNMRRKQHADNKSSRIGRNPQEQNNQDHGAKLLKQWEEVRRHS
jgi:hypothetical protein